jgi:hypothetical protein
VVRAVIEFLNRVTLGLLDLLLGFIAWPPKRIRLHVFILWSEPPPVIEGNPPAPIEQVVQDAINHTKRIYKERFNVNVLPYSKSFIHMLVTKLRTGSTAAPHRQTATIIIRWSQKTEGRTAAFPLRTAIA